MPTFPPTAFGLHDRRLGISSERQSRVANRFGQYVSIWQKQADENFKAVLDIGITQAIPERVETDWKSPTGAGENLGDTNSPVALAVNLIFDTATMKGLNNADKLFAAEDVRLLREGKLLILGKN